jgi:predicted metal-dependent hydrolase
MRFALKRAPERLIVEVAEREYSVAVKRNKRARRLILRIDAASGLPVMTLPARTSLAEGERFLLKNLGWLEGRLGRRPPAIPFGDGGEFSLRGAVCRIAHCGGRGLIRLERDGDAQRLVVPGDIDFLPRRVADWLRREARRDIEAAVARHAQAIGRRPAGIRIGDAKSRWGSCSAQGALSFSWRLVLAPPHVLDYLAAHEVAHLAEMNHGRRFWALVDRLCPAHRPARAWLKRNGAELYAVGRPF